MHTAYPPRRAEVTVTLPPAARKPRPLAVIAGALAIALGAVASAQTPAEIAPLADEASALHGTCARRAARVLGDLIAAPLARQGRWIAEIERGRRSSFRVVQDAVAPGRPLAETFVALLDYADSPDAVRRYGDAAVAADAVRERYLALVYLLEAALPVLAFEQDSAGTAAELLRAGERLLADATDEARSRRAAFVERRLTSGVDYADEGIVRAALDESRAEYQQCVLAGTLAAADTRDATPDAVGEAGRCMRAVSGEARPTALPDVFRPSGLLARECRAVLGAAPQIVAQAEALLAQRREGRAAAAAAASTPPARPPEHGPLRDQVLSPGELRAWLGRTYGAEMYCHREAASVYRAAFAPFIDAAEAVARAALDRELESRAARTRAELERRLDGLDKVLASAVNIDNALAVHGVRGVPEARASLRNLTGGARNQRDAFERALAALDPAALAAERIRRLAEIAERYAAERRRLAEWRARFDMPPDPREHPAVAGESAPVELDFPYGAQHPDRALRNGVLGAANAANAHLNACRAANAGAAALVRPAPARGVCDTWPPRDRFLQWGFVRATERTTVERCSVDLAALDAPLGLAPAPHDETELARLAALAARVAAAAPAPDLPAALARIESLTADFNDRLREVEQRLAAIRARLEAGNGERLAVVAPPDGERAPADAPEPAGADPADPPALEPLDMDSTCRAREAEQRAALPSALGQTVFVRYDEEAVWQQWAGRPRPDGRAGSVDPCQVVHCPAEIETYDECVAHANASFARQREEQRRAETRQNWERTAQWIVDNVLPAAHAAADRFYHHPQGDTWLERTTDRAMMLTCTMSSMAMPVKSVFKRLLGLVAEEAASEIARSLRRNPASEMVCDVHIRRSLGQTAGQ